jgi:hypothetical protein
MNENTQSASLKTTTGAQIKNDTQRINDGVLVLNNRNEY